MQLSFRLDKRPGESHLALDGKNNQAGLYLWRCFVVQGQCWHLTEEYFLSVSFPTCCSSAFVFFSSGLADVALRLGPYMSISCRKDVCTRTQLVHTSRQIKIETTKNHKTTKPRRPANPPARLAFRQRKQQTRQKTKPDTQKGPEPEQNTHEINLPRDTVV